MYYFHNYTKNSEKSDSSVDTSDTALLPSLIAIIFLAGKVTENIRSIRDISNVVNKVMDLSRSITDLEKVFVIDCRYGISSSTLTIISM